MRVNKLPQSSISTFYFTDLDNGNIGHYLGNPHTGPAQYTYNSDSAIDAAVTAIKESYGPIRNAAKAQANFHEASKSVACYPKWEQLFTTAPQKNIIK